MKRQWLDLGLDEMPEGNAQRIRMFRLILAAASRLRGRLDRALAASGITTQQAAMLQLIESRPAPPTISEVAELVEMTHQNVKQIAIALERKGFLAIVVDENDRRIRRLVLTPKHRRFWKKRNPDDFANVLAWTAALDDEEVATMVRLLVRMHRHLDDPS